MLLLFRLMSSRKVKIGIATISVQGANLALLYFAKVLFSDSIFTFYLTQVAFAGIIGAIATMRFELLIYQKLGRMSIAAALMPFAFAVIVTVISIPLVIALRRLGINLPEISPWALLLLLSIGISTATDFLFVQARQITLLLLSRMCQAIGLASIAGMLLFQIGLTDPETLLLVQGLAMSLPVLIWILFYFAKYLSAECRQPVMLIPEIQLWQRSFFLTSSTGVNAVYINIPILLSAATQSASFTADLGLILRFLTGPVTFVRQIYGQLFLASALEWSKSVGKKTIVLRKMITKVRNKAGISYIILSIPIVLFLIIGRNHSNIQHIEILPWLYITSLSQSLINPISQVRSVLEDEKNFLFFDTFRMLILFLTLYLLPSYLGFEIVFGTISCSLYLAYGLFISKRVNEFENG